MAMNETVARRRARGPTDPARRGRIARAAIAVVARRGIAGLTHRAVAAEAGVPLGSTTYHFATLDDLLTAALADAAEANIAHLRDWDAALPPDADLAGALADLTMASLTADRDRTIVEYQLYAAALHHPSLRPACAAWDNAMAELFGSRTDPVAGKLLGATLCGLLMQYALCDPLPGRAEVEAIFRRAIG